ncbi:MAG: glycoside hydrolase family 3 C-terminal domain-containing protein [Bacilli bacterium]|nr:glycoside hydrolase family 3 C-terminal domain-containing protein [Bacilli bacterium]
MKRTTAVINFSTIIMLASLLTVATKVAMDNALMIDSFLTKQTINVDEHEMEELRAQGKELAQKIVEDGSVLLKNQDNVLPLKSKRVNIFGWCASDNGFLYQGGGSSEGGYSADKISLYQAFRDVGYEINEQLASDYNRLGYRREGAPDQNQHSTYYRTYDAGEDFFTEARMSQARNFSDTAIMVFSRRATEGDDLPKVNYDESGNPDASRNYLSLSKKEAIMVKHVTNNFDKVICLFNSSAPMEMGFVDYPKIDAAMYIGYPGYYGTTAVAKLLCGENGANPSGHLSDTAAYDLRTAPSFVNTGLDATKTYKERGGRYTDYAEDIYVGYKWYETADAEGYYDDVGLDIYKKERRGYDAIVQYPFGYGQSYTTFKHTFEGLYKGDTKVSATTPIDKNDTLTARVYVENTGNVAGKDAVQLYFTPPYTKGGIEKSAVNLLEFRKTEKLEPGKTQIFNIDFKVSDLASYDAYDKNNNGFMGYEVESGNYVISLRTDSHHVSVVNNAKQEEKFTLNSGFTYDKDTTTGAEVKNRFTTYSNSTSGASSTIHEPQATYAISIDGNDSNSSYNQGITYLTRADFAGTFPKSTEIRRMDSTMYNNVFRVHDPFNDPNDTMPVTGSTSTSLTLNDVKGLPYDDPKWEQLVSQLDINTMAELIAHGGFGTNAIPSINKPRCTDSDGGTGFTSGVVSGDGGHAVKYPAANVLANTFDIKLAELWGHAIGNEGKALGIQGWYAPGCNVHRSPLGGRNFEYFSEDGKMCGYFVAYTVKGCTENGVYAYAKHFAGNDSDEGRNGQFKWMTEQSLREIWAKPGELAVKIGGANAFMISVDRVGSVRATGSYALLTSLLRDEWGFHGSTITDYYQAGDTNDIDEGIRAGNDLCLHPGLSRTVFADNGNWSATTVKYIKNSVHNILFTYIDTVHRTETSTGVSQGEAQIGEMTEDNQSGWWRPLLTGVDIGAGVLLAGWATVTVLFTWVLKRKKVTA